MRITEAASSIVHLTLFSLLLGFSLFESSSKTDFRGFYYEKYLRKLFYSFGNELRYFIYLLLILFGNG